MAAMNMLLAVSLAGCGMTAVRTVRLAGQSPRRLNNFVTELLLVKGLEADGVYKIGLSNPREGWLFFRSRAVVGRRGKMTVTVKSETETEARDVIALSPGDGRTREVMRYLPEGEYTLRIVLKGAALESLSVRTIPAIIFANFPYPPHLARFGRYDWSQLKGMGILENCNVIITGFDGFHAMSQWLAEGKQVLQQVGVPGLQLKGKVTAESAYEYWVSKRGMSDPAMSGVIADEFYGSLRNLFPALIHAIKRVRREHPNKVFYPYIAGSGKGLREFVEPLMDTDCRFAYERYLTERPTEAEAKEYIERALKKEMLDFESYFPDFSSRCIYVMGFLCGPNESLNCNPQVNFKVFTDMQFNLLANDPALDDLYGVEQYLSGYCDEEYMRWCAKLFRHYCIEGARDRLTRDPYLLAHIQNPDFKDGLNGWTVEAAEPGCVTTGAMKDYGWLQGRYPRSAAAQGDTFLLMKRSAKKANVVSQQIRNLTPGRFYSAKMYTAAYDDLTRCEKLSVSLRIEGAAQVPEENIQGTFFNCYSHLSEKFGKKKTYFNFHRVVFKATSETARLVISDWSSETRPGAPAGRRISFNFVEVEPYLMPDAFRDR